MGDRLENLQVRNVDKTIWERFKTAVVDKTGNLRGVLGVELAEALKLYIEKGDMRWECDSDGSQTRPSQDPKNERNYLWERRVVKMGVASHGITLPSDWVKKMRLNTGDKITVGINTDGTLVIAAGDSSAEYQDEERNDESLDAYF